jgi:hypothetical protein
MLLKLTKFAFWTLLGQSRRSNPCIVLLIILAMLVNYFTRDSPSSKTLLVLSIGLIKTIQELFQTKILWIFFELKTYTDLHYTVINFYYINRDDYIQTHDRLVIKALIPCQITISIKKFKLLDKILKYNLYYFLTKTNKKK